MVAVESDIECCANCNHCIDYPRNNNYKDADHLCTVNGYFMHSINKDRHTVKHFTPGGRELECKYKRRITK